MLGESKHFFFRLSAFQRLLTTLGAVSETTDAWCCVMDCVLLLIFVAAFAVQCAQSLTRDELQTFTSHVQVILLKFS